MQKSLVQILVLLLGMFVAYISSFSNASDAVTGKDIRFLVIAPGVATVDSCTSVETRSVPVCNIAKQTPNPVQTESGAESCEDFKRVALKYVAKGLILKVRSGVKWYLSQLKSFTLS